MVRRGPFHRYFKTNEAGDSFTFDWCMKLKGGVFNQSITEQKWPNLLFGRFFKRRNVPFELNNNKSPGSQKTNKVDDGLVYNRETPS